MMELEQERYSKADVLEGRRRAGEKDQAATW